MAIINQPLIVNSGSQPPSSFGTFQTINPANVIGTNVPQVQQGFNPSGQDTISSFDPSSVLDSSSSGSNQEITVTANKKPTDPNRIRLRAIAGQEDQVYGPLGDNGNILSILHPLSPAGTNGLLFPYTPAITVTQAVEYGSMQLTHTIGDIQTYSHTPSVTISLSAKFTVQNQREGRYALAALHLLRVISKMYFGEQDKAAGLAGLPPPVMIFTGYGSYMFNNLPVILKSHSYTFDEHMDMVTVNTNGGIARLPPLFTVSIDLAVQQTPKAMREYFSLDKFRTGALMRQNGKTGWL